MAEAYNVRFDGQRYWVYRIDGNSPVADYVSGAEAQSKAAIMNQQYNEQFGKKKAVESTTESPTGWVEEQLPKDKGIGANPVSDSEPTTSTSTAGSAKSDSVPPDPPPGQGVSY